MAKYPQGALEEMEPSAIREIVISLRQLHDLGKPQSDEEVRSRIDYYFSFCEESSVRPGIESMCMALHITRTTLFNWSNGIGCSQERQEIIESAKAFISAYLEQAMLGGKISPPSGIFLLKNWCSYRDLVSFEERLPDKKEERLLGTGELPDLRAYGMKRESLDCKQEGEEV